MANLLTKTSKMACHSWSLPAGPDVCAGFAAGKGTICRSCYAAQGMYHMPNVKNAQALRLDRWRNDPTIDADLIDEINRKRSRYFRVFDSGDFTTIDDVNRWHAIAMACPDKLFWIPSRTWRLGPQWLEALQALNRLPNVVVRASGLRWNEAPPQLGLPIATVVDDGSGDCPAGQNHSDCESEGCRKCWDSDNAETRFVAHGRPVNWRKRLAR